MSQIKSGDHVEYSCKKYLENGTILAADEENTEFVQAGCSFTNAPIREIVSNALVDMEARQTKKIVVPAAKAFGDYSENLIFRFPIEESPENLEAGETLTIQLNEGGEMEGRVTRIDDGVVFVDANHPHAGQNLILEISIVGVH